MDYKNFLSAISQLESSGGKNTRHKTIASGHQSGQTAVGKYGLLPNTVEEMVKRAQQEGTSLPEMDELAHLSQHEISNRIAKDPNLEDELAFRLYDHIAKKTQDPEKMAYMWNTGHNLNPEDIDVSDSSYVQKFNKAALKGPALQEEMMRRVKESLNNPEETIDPRMAALEKLSRGY